MSQPCNIAILNHFDAAGRTAQFRQFTGVSHAQDAKDVKVDTTYDGDGRPVKEQKFDRECDDAEFPGECTVGWFDFGAVYYLYSSVTGQKITDMGNGLNGGQHVYMGGTKIAYYSNYENGNYRLFTETDPVTGSWVYVESPGSVPNGDSYRAELAGLGTSVPLTAPESFPPILNYDAGYVGDAEFGCTDEWDDRVPCTVALMLANRGERNKDKKPPLGPELPDYFIGADNKRQGYRGLRKVSYYTGYNWADGGEPINGDMWILDPSRNRGGDCDLQVPTFDQLGTVNYGGSAALSLLNNTYGKTARPQYESMTLHNKAVFLNTVEAVAAQGVNLANAQFVDFYNGDSGKPNYGIYVSGVATKNLDTAGLKERHYGGVNFGRRPDQNVKEGSVEATVLGNGDIAFDVDLNNPYSAAFLAHAVEAGENYLQKKSTDPVDAMRRLNHRNVFTGVRCIPRGR
ncbi:MAG: hypothetical protein KBD94_06885 [Pyrinomonadaceae bacterium]|nr:hypothetical protein [Pyrinomonadaceae bacterium]